MRASPSAGEPAAHHETTSANVTSPSPLTTRSTVGSSSRISRQQKLGWTFPRTVTIAGSTSLAAAQISRASGSIAVMAPTPTIDGRVSSIRRRMSACVAPSDIAS